jgi:hypothetical protein
VSISGATLTSSNVFNHCDNANNVVADGMQATRSSGNWPRTLQFERAADI